MQILNTSALTEDFITFSVYLYSTYFIDTIFKPFFLALFTQQVIFYYFGDKIKNAVVYLVF